MEIRGGCQRQDWCAVWGEECDGERKEIRIVTEFTCEESGDH